MIFLFSLLFFPVLIQPLFAVSIAVIPSSSSVLGGDPVRLVVIDDPNTTISAVSFSAVDCATCPKGPISTIDLHRDENHTLTLFTPLWPCGPGQAALIAIFANGSSSQPIPFTFVKSGHTFSDVNCAALPHVGEHWAATHYIHSAGMAFGWGFLAPAAVYFARYQKSRLPWWLSAHKILITFGAGSILPLFVTGIVGAKKRNFGAEYHTTACWIFLVLVLSQLWAGNVLAWKSTSENYASARKFNIGRRLHRAVGRTIIVMAWAQVGTGLAELEVHSGYWILMGLYIAIVCIVFALEEVRSRRSWSRTAYSIAPSLGHTELPSISAVAFQASVQRGLSWAIMDGFVVNLAPMLESHPGGLSILQRSIGRDVTASFAGVSGPAKHSHSNDAHRRAIELRTAKIASGDKGSAVSERFGEAPPNFVQCSITSLDVLEIGPRAVLHITFQAAGSFPSVIPGQHIKVALRNKDAWCFRDYTPLGNNELLIRLVPGGTMSELLRSLTVGSVFSASLFMPHGSPIAPRGVGVKALYLISAGTGIGPFLFYLREVRDRGYARFMEVPITVVLVNHGRGPLEEVLTALQRDFDSSGLRVVRVDTSLDGRPGQEFFAALVSQRVASAAQAYIAGPPGFEAAVQGHLQAAGVPEQNITLCSKEE